MPPWHNNKNMKDRTNASNTASPPETKGIPVAMGGTGRCGGDRAGPDGPRDNANDDAPSLLDQKRLADVRILGGTMIFYSVLQTAMQYVGEFYADDLREASGLEHPRNFPAVSMVIANVFNGVNGGLALATAVVAGPLIRRAWSGDGGSSKCARWFFKCFCAEALVTSGVMHSVAHRIFGATLDGNAFVEFFAHIGFTVNVIVTATLLVGWLAPSRLGAGEGGPPGWCPRPIEVALAVAGAVLAVFFTQRWVPYEPDPADFDYDEDHEYNETRIVFLQRHVQGGLEGVLLVPTVLLLFVLRRLWGSIDSSSTTPEGGETRLSTDAFRVCILSTVLPLCLNWIHFRCHDDLVRYIQPTFGWDHSETIAAVRVAFHIPAWVLAVARTHHFRLLAEERAGWPPLDVLETLCPGREVFPFVMVFLYRATEGMTLALLPTFFSGMERGSDNRYFYLDITDNAWVAVTVLGMFVGNAVGAVALGYLMQKKGYERAFLFLCPAYLAVLALYMAPHTNASFVALRSASALLFPGPVVLSRITQNTRRTFRGAFKHVPMIVSLVWFNQGIWFGSVISNSSVWTPWNAFFSSAVILFILFACLFVSFLVRNRDSPTYRLSGPVSACADGKEEKPQAPIEENDRKVTKWIDSTPGSGCSSVCNEEKGSPPIEEDKCGVEARNPFKPQSRQSLDSRNLLVPIEEDDIETSACGSSEPQQRHTSLNSPAGLRKSFQRQRSSLNRGSMRDLRASFQRTRNSMRDLSIRDLRESFEKGSSYMGNSFMHLSSYAVEDFDFDTSTDDNEEDAKNISLNDENEERSEPAPLQGCENIETQNSLRVARLSSFINGASFACHISLLPIQVTKLVDLDLYEYTTIVSSLGSISTVLILMSFKWMAKKDSTFSMAVAYGGHIIGTAILCLPQIYTTSRQGFAVLAIVVFYGIVLLSFFIMNLSCEVSLGEKSLKQKSGKDAAAGLQMGLIKSLLSLGKVCGAALVALGFRYHPQSPLWILEVLLLIGALTFAFSSMKQKNERTIDEQK